MLFCPLRESEKDHEDMPEGLLNDNAAAENVEESVSDPVSLLETIDVV